MDSLKRAWAELFDLEAPLAFFPVRHHSPACAEHLRRTLERYQPDAILIEGPADTGELIPHIGNPDNKAPLCIYYSSVYKTRGEDGKPLEERYSCYYPLLDYSPELTAIRYGVERGVDTRFIDLPYSALSLLERREREEGKESYYDDYYLARSRFIQRLCEKEGCRHYGELWERLFEMGGLRMDTEAFVESMLALCHYSRVEYPEELLRREGCLSREGYMALAIREAMAERKRILAITGGFHTAALAELVKNPPPPEDLPKGDAHAYLIPYSFAESDQLMGYRSGMPYPAFYQRIHEGLGMKREGAPEADSPWDAATLEFLARIGGALRRRKESASIADEIAAVNQARGLAALRGKREPGVYELLDGVRSAYVKSELSGADVIGETVTGLLRGDRMGEVRSGAEQVPLLTDFREAATRLRIQLDRTRRRDITLEILAKPVHREASAFFHRLQYLNAGFAERKFGPDYRSGDTGRVREKWTYAFSARVESALIEVSYLGGSVREAAATALNRRKQQDTGCGEYTRMLIDAAVMDLTGEMKALLERTREAVARDGDFRSLAQAVENLLFLESAEWLLELEDTEFASILLESVYDKAVALLPTLDTASEEDDREIAGAFRSLGQLSRRDNLDGETLEQALADICARKNPPPMIHGAAEGLLYAYGLRDASATLGSARGYFFGSGDRMKLSGRFLSGVFLSAWDILFADSGFLEGLTHVLRTLEQDAFLELLPDLRLAFSAFTPTQIDRVAGAVAELLGLSGGQELRQAPVSEDLLRLGRELDAYAAMNEKGVRPHAG